MRATSIKGAAGGLWLVIFGAHVDALILGLFGALFVSVWLDSIDNKFKAASAVLFSAVLAAYASPVVTLYVSAKLPSLLQDTETLRLLLALVIGAAAPIAIPLSLKYATKRLKK
jgi:FtsH-binding integral membrane protein